MSNYTRLAGAMLLGGLLTTLAACTQQPSTPATAGASDWQQRCGMMQQYCMDMHAAKTPEERQKLMEQHWQLMRDNKMMMPNGCPMGMMGGGTGMGSDMMGAGMGAGMMGQGQGMGAGMMGQQGMSPDTMGQGMGPGAMMGSLTAEQLDQRIQQMEAMLKQLKEQRAKIGK